MFIDDKYHIVRIKEGNEESFEKVFVKYYNKLCRYANEILNSEDDSKDVVIEVFTNIWEKRKEINVKLSLASYLYRSVYNRSLNVIRNRRNKINTGDLTRNDFISSLLKEDDDDFPLSGLLQSENIEKIKSAIDKLPEKCKQIFLLHRKFRFKYFEIAKLLDISEHTVKAQVQIALRKLRNELFLPVKKNRKTK